MSILIKGMKMPEHCGYCRFRYDGICHALQKTQYSVKECPLVELPDHGDLIDAEEQMRLMQACEYDTYDDYERAFDMLDNAPTIIPAERSGEEDVSVTATGTATIGQGEE